MKQAVESFLGEGCAVCNKISPRPHSWTALYNGVSIEYELCKKCQRTFTRATPAQRRAINDGITDFIEDVHRERAEVVKAKNPAPASKMDPTIDSGSTISDQDKLGDRAKA